ncbi:MAG: AraC family transcriptional regulator, partial [Cellulomonadaceae bacterium]
MVVLTASALFSGLGPPLAVREQQADSPSGPVVAEAVKVVFGLSGWAHVFSSHGSEILEAGKVLVIPAGVECSGFPLGHARTVTFYLYPEYLADQVRWLSGKHPLVHHLHRALDGDPALHSLQLAPSSMYDLATPLTSLSQSSTGVLGDFALLSIASDVFDAVGRLSGVSSGNVELTSVVPRREVAAAIALLRADLGRSWRMDELAREVAVSPSHLARLFRMQVGVSPAAFLRQLRADRMAELL